MTNREFFTAVINGTFNEEVIAHAQDAIEKLDARNAKRSSTPSKTQRENEPIKQAIVDFVRAGKSVTISEIAQGLEISSQKSSALCRQLVASGILAVADTKIKGRGTVKVYSIAQ